MYLLFVSYVIITDIDVYWCVSAFLTLLIHIQRYEIVNGVVEVEGAPEEVKTEQGEDKAAEGVCYWLLALKFVKSYISNVMKTCFPAEKGVPDFWLIALKNNEITAEEVRYKDTLILFVLC